VPRFLVEVAHEPDALACVHVLEAFLRSGSHFLTRADWGCKDGDHRAWMIVEVGTKDEARNIVPSEFRLRTRVVGLHGFTVAEVAEMRRVHGMDP
jgi:hypothetical protein